MHCFKATITAVCLVLGLSFATAHAADTLKIGLIDFQQIVNQSEAGKAAQAKIAEKLKSFEADLKAKSAAFNQEKAAYEKEASVLSAEARSERERALKIKSLDLQDLEAKYKNELNTFNQGMSKQFRDNVLKAANEIGAKEGYTLILEKNEGGVLYALPAIDITDTVIKKVNESNGKTK